jgi:hypothetical protein
MGLWSPGTLEGITSSILARVCEQAFEDHVAAFGPREQYDVRPVATDMLAPSDMPIREISNDLSGDLAFDRVSYARATGETFWYGSVKFRVSDYGAGWTIEALTDATYPGGEIRAGDKLRKIPEDQIARLLDSQNGAHPNPYVARVEVSYDSADHRAGYGIRADGSFALWYD